MECVTGLVRIALEAPDAIRIRRCAGADKAEQRNQNGSLHGSLRDMGRWRDLVVRFGSTHLPFGANDLSVSRVSIITVQSLTRAAGSSWLRQRVTPLAAF